MIIVALLAMCAQCALAATTTNTTTDKSCPVQIIRNELRERAGEYTLSLRYGNRGASKLVGAKFSLDLMDATRDWTPYLNDLTASEQVSVRHMGDSSWDLLLYNQSVAGYRVTLKKLAFDDGTSWEDDGTKKCNVTVSR